MDAFQTQSPILAATPTRTNPLYTHRKKYLNMAEDALARRLSSVNGQKYLRMEAVRVRVRVRISVRVGVRVRVSVQVSEHSKG